MARHYRTHSRPVAQRRVDEYAALRCQLTEIQAALAAAPTPEPSPAPEVEPRELMRLHGEWRPILEIRRGRVTFSDNTPHTAVFREDGYEVRANVYPEVLKQLHAYGYTASAIRAGVVFRAPIGAILEFSEKWGLKVKEFDTPKVKIA